MRSIDTDNLNQIDNRLVALDLETSASEHQNWDGVILSIGLVHVGTGEEFYQEIKYKNTIPVRPGSMRYNPHDIEEVDQYDEGQRIELSKADNAAREWLEEVTDVCKQWKLKAVGFGVGHFDLPYMMYCTEPMPRTRNMFSHAPLDLTDICQALDVCAGQGMGTLKKKVKQAVDSEHTHHALEDARQAAEVLLKLREHVDVERFW